MIEYILFRFPGITNNTITIIVCVMYAKHFIELGGGGLD